ncbi:hypothetical protein ACLQ25_32095 [Micromonospora sp. DT44]|uniref:hypothetical protein n=1 Tax=Micromonospora sp. DT44 TaxID=3393439 RepID=UPI003CE976DD
MAAVLTDRLGFPVAAASIWPGRGDPGRSNQSAATGLGEVNHLDDLVRELTHLTTAAATPHSPIGGASGADLTAVVLDQLHGAVLAARNRAGHEFVLSEQVDVIACHVAALRRLDDRHGGGALSVRYVTAELRSVMDLVQHANYGTSTGRRLLTIVADLAQLLGWLHFDSSRYGASERYLLLSVGVCRTLGDQERSANAIGMLSYVSTFAGHGPEAVRLAEAAKSECRSGDLVLRAKLVGREATAAAANGDLAQFRRCAEEAAEMLNHGQTRDRPSFLYYLSPMQLSAEAGQALVVLAERTTANRHRLLGEGIDLLSGAVAGMIAPGEGAAPAYARSGLLHSTFLARAQLQHGDVGEAIATMRAGIGLLPLVQSPRGRHYLRGLRPALARRSRSPVVREFIPEFDAAVSSV